MNPSGPPSDAFAPREQQGSGSKGGEQKESPKHEISLGAWHPPLVVRGVRLGWSSAQRLPPAWLRCLEGLFWRRRQREEARDQNHSARLESALAGTPASPVLGVPAPSCVWQVHQRALISGCTGALCPGSIGQ